MLKRQQWKGQMKPRAVDDLSEDRQREELLKASIGASERSRRVMFISQIFGLLILIATVNTLITDWMSVRRDVARDARLILWCIESDSRSLGNQQPTVPRLERYEHLWSYSDDTPPSDGGVSPSTASHLATPVVRSNVDRTYQESMTAGERANESAVWRLMNACRVRLPRVYDTNAGIDRMRRAAWLLVKRRWMEQDITSIYGIMDGLERDVGYSVPVSFLGMRMDINDLGGMAGVVHLTVLGWLYLSVRREQELVGMLRGHRLNETYRFHNFFSEISGAATSRVATHLDKAAAFFVGALLVGSIVRGSVAAVGDKDRWMFLPEVIFILLVAAIVGYALSRVPKGGGPSAHGSQRSWASVLLASTALLLPLGAFMLLSMADYVSAVSLSRYYGHPIVTSASIELFVCSLNGGMSSVLFLSILGGYSLVDDEK